MAKACVLATAVISHGTRRSFQSRECSRQKRSSI